jgi:uncharacterized membrane protein/thiol-disulfide isomerase/thioredoxin
MNRVSRFLLLVIAVLTLSVQPLRAAENVVRAVLFYSPYCGHCHYVITEVLPPIMDQYGNRFELVGVDTADPQGQAMYQAAVQHFEVAEERLGVPALIIGDHVLVGSVEIPEQLPGLIESYLEQGGVDWPAVPGLAEALAAPSATPTPAPTGGDTADDPVFASPSPSPPSPTITPTPDVPLLLSVEEVSGPRGDWRANFQRDPAGNALSLVVLLGMIVSLIYHGLAVRRPAAPAAVERWRWIVPPLVALGLAVAGYLAYVETQQVVAVCGPVGDCNTVQQSEFALLFGFLPVAVLGLLGYIGIGVAWAVARYGSGLWADLALVSMQVMASFGLLFSIYLTFLEPFVIGATCAWCLTSAVVMTVLFWVVMPAARPALVSLRARLGQPLSV